jgi:hypothetical protein
MVTLQIRATSTYGLITLRREHVRYRPSLTLNHTYLPISLQLYFSPSCQGDGNKYLEALTICILCFIPG